MVVVSTSHRDVNSDIISIIVSNLGVLVQIAAISLIGVSSAFGVDKVIDNSDLLRLTNFFVFVVAVSAIGSYSYFATRSEGRKSGRGLLFKKLEPYVLLTTSFFSFISFIFFIISSYVLINQANQDKWIWPLLQIISYSGVMTLASLNVYVWMHNLLKSYSRFRDTDFIDNFKSALRENGYLNDPVLKIIENNVLTNGNRIIVFRINDQQFGEKTSTIYFTAVNNDSTSQSPAIASAGDLYMLTSNDGKIIYKLLDLKDKELLLSQN